MGGYTPTGTLGSVFTIPASLSSFSSMTFLQALQFAPAGTTLQDDIMRLFSQVMAALLNAANPAVNYPMGTTQIITFTNIALDSGDQAAISSLRQVLGGNNMLTCPLPP